MPLSSPLCLVQWCQARSIRPPLPPLLVWCAGPHLVGSSEGGISTPGVSDILAALLTRAKELGLELSPPSDGVPAQAAALASWQARCATLCDACAAHAELLQGAMAEAVLTGDTASVDDLRALLPAGLISAVLPHCSEGQRARLLAVLESLVS
jgi:hypothetical protein